MGDTRPELSRFYQRIAKISQLEGDTIKCEDSRRKPYSKPTTYTTNATNAMHLSRSASARTLNKVTSVKSVARRCGTISLNDQSENHLQSPIHDIVSHTPLIGSLTHNDVTTTNDVIHSHTQNITPTNNIDSHTQNDIISTNDIVNSRTQNDITPTDDVINSTNHDSTTDHETCKPDIELPAADVMSLSRSDKDSNSEIMVCGPVLLCNGQLTTQDYEHARRHLSKSHDQLVSCRETTCVTSHPKTRKKPSKNRPRSTTHLLTESSSSTSVSSVCSDKSHVKQSRLSSNKKKHKK